LTPPEDLVSGSIGHRTPSRWGATGSWHVPAQSPTRPYDDLMTDPGRGSGWTASLLSGVLAAIILIAGCNGDGAAPTPAAASPGPSTTASPATAASPSKASPGADLTPVPGGQTASPLEPSGTPTQTDTAWGRIWDAVPASFPRVEASTPADSVTGPVSAAFVVEAGPADVTATMKRLLDSAGYTTDQSGPLEDGSFVLDSTGAPAGCRAQTTLAPQASSTLMTVLFGAICPFE
jgi:hypothetical protein